MSEDNFYCYCSACQKELNNFYDIRFLNYRNKKSEIYCPKCFEVKKFDIEDGGEKS